MMKCSGEVAKLRVLLVDDDRKLCALIADYLEPLGYACRSVYDGASALDLIGQETFQAIILDVMMPDMDGLEVLRRLREFCDTPVLMLTALDAETDRIVGLELGADDYLPKSFSSRELLARLRAVTRRFQRAEEGKMAPKPAPSLHFKDLAINLQARQVLLKGQMLDLTPFEFDLLACLAAEPGRVLSREQLLDRVAERPLEAFDRSIDVHVSSLRRKLRDNAKHPSYIQTVRASGYMFVGQAVAGDEA